MQYENRTLFLELFTRELIKNSYGKGFVVKANLEDLEKEYEKEMEKVRILSGNIPQYSSRKEKQLQPKKIQSLPVLKRHEPIKKPKRVEGMFLPTPYGRIEKKQKIQPMLVTQQRNTAPAQQQSMEIPLQTPTQQNQNKIINGFQKLNPVLSDPRVIEIECPGPNRFILVKTATKLMNSGLKMNQKEIRSVIEYFATETRIPLIGGLFKAVKDNLLISAVESDAAGSRFIIKKLGPQSVNNQSAG
jgi:hypothetical protein